MLLSVEGENKGLDLKKMERTAMILELSRRASDLQPHGHDLGPSMSSSTTKNQVNVTFRRRRRAGQSCWKWT